jgi:hypothetical protein
MPGGVLAVALHYGGAHSGFGGWIGPLGMTVLILVTLALVSRRSKK